MMVSVLSADESGVAYKKATFPGPPPGQTLQWFPLAGSTLVRSIYISREDEDQDESKVARLERENERLNAKLDELAAILRGEWDDNYYGGEDE
jgi:hypothetical protein